MLSLLGKIRCSHCGARYHREMILCPRCGRTLSQRRESEQCPACGARVLGNQSACPICGARREVKTAVAPSGRWVLGTVGLVLAAMAVLAWTKPWQGLNLRASFGAMPTLASAEPSRAPLGGATVIPTWTATARPLAAMAAPTQTPTEVTTAIPTAAPLQPTETATAILTLTESSEAIATPVSVESAADTPYPEVEPSPTATLSATPEQVVHFLGEGEDLSTLAAMYGVSAEAIAKANEIEPSAILAVGRKLIIPTPTALSEGTPLDASPTPTEPLEAMPTLTLSPAAEPFFHLVREGQDLAALARDYGLAIEDLARVNGLTVTTPLTTGQRLIIPIPTPTSHATPSTAPSPEATATPEPTPTLTPIPTPTPIIHVIKAGEYLAVLARMYGVEPEAIAEANNIGLRTTLHIGQRLIIPVTPTAPAESPTEAPTAEPTTADAESASPVLSPTATPSPSPSPAPITHTVQRGDNLGSIAARYGSTVEAIARANNIRTTTILSIGQKLVIPGLVPLPTATATPSATPTAAATSTPVLEMGRTPVPDYPYLQPRLLAPADRAAIEGSGTVVLLNWTSSGILQEGEWYELRVWVPGQSDPKVFWTRATSWRVPEDMYPQGERNAGEPQFWNANVFAWQVTVVSREANGESGAALSLPSERYTFVWK